MARADRRRVHERLERRAGLADRLRGAVVLRVVEIASADHRADVAGVRFQRDQRALQVGREQAVVLARRLGRLDVLAIGGAPRELPVRVHSRFDRVELRLQRALGRFLHVEVERRIDPQATLVEVAPEACVELGGTQPLDEVRGHVAVIGAVRGEHERVGLPQLGVLGTQKPLVPHQAQHHVAPPHGALGVSARIIEGGSLGQRGERGGLCDVQLPCRLAEVNLRRRLDPVGARSEIDLVQVQLEDRVFGKVVLDFDRDPRLFELAGQLLLAADLVRKDVPGELHRDRREPLRISERDEVGLRGAQDADVVDSMVGVEPLVFGRDERLPHGDRNLGERQHRAALQAKLTDQPAVRGEDLRCLHLHFVAGTDQARDARAVLAGADPGP